MNKAKKSKRTHLAPPASFVTGDSPFDAVHSSEVTPTQQEITPAPWVRSLVSVLVVIHLFAISASLFGVVEPSETHLAIVRSLSPYLRVTHFGAEDRTVYLANGEPREQPHRVQVLRGGANEQWQTIEPAGWPGMGQSDRYARWVGAMVNFTESEQSGLVAALLLPQLENLRAADPSRPILQVRIIRLPTELTTLADDAEPPPYVAAIMERGSRMDLVRIRTERLNAKSDAAGEIPGSSSGVENR